MSNANTPAALVVEVESLDKELAELRRNAARYRVLREQGVRINDGTTVQRAGGLDTWCDERLALELAKPGDCS